MADDPPAVAALAGPRTAVNGLPNFAPVADDVLHLTGPGVGFADELDPQAVTSMVDEVGEALCARPPFQVRLSNPWVAGTGVGLGVAPSDRAPLTSLRLQTRRAIARAGVPVPGDDGEDYRPHVTLAYTTGVGPTAPAHRALAAVWREDIPLRICHWTLLALRMTPPTYEWDVVARLPLGAEG